MKMLGKPDLVFRQRLFYQTRLVLYQVLKRDSDLKLYQINKRRNISKHKGKVYRKQMLVFMTTAEKIIKKHYK